MNKLWNSTCEELLTFGSYLNNLNLINQKVNSLTEINRRDLSISEIQKNIIKSPV
jgi:hypothetical protein